MEKQKRKKFIIEGNFQTRLILKFVAVVTGAALLSVITVISLFLIKYNLTLKDFANLTVSLAGKGVTGASNFFEIVLAPIIISNLIVLCIVIPVSLFYSHRIAGPIYRFEQSLDLLLHGNTNFMISLRKKDEFKYLADKMNALIDYMRRNINEVKMSHKVLKDRINRIHSMLSVEQIDLPALKREIRELERFFKERGTPFSY